MSSRVKHAPDQRKHVLTSQNENEGGGFDSPTSTLFLKYFTWSEHVFLDPGLTQLDTASAYESERELGKCRVGVDTVLARRRTVTHVATARYVRFLA